MTNEPVAYYKDFSDGTRLFFNSNELCDMDNSDNLIKPLYTKEQLHPRVKMTQAEFDDWHKLYECNTLFSSVMALLDDDKYVEKYNNLYMKIYTGEDAQNIIMKLFLQNYGLNITLTTQKKQLRLFLE